MLSLIFWLLISNHITILIVYNLSLYPFYWYSASNATSSAFYQQSIILVYIEALLLFMIKLILLPLFLLLQISIILNNIPSYKLLFILFWSNLSWFWARLLRFNIRFQRLLSFNWLSSLWQITDIWKGFRLKMEWTRIPWWLRRVGDPFDYRSGRWIRWLPCRDLLWAREIHPFHLKFKRRIHIKPLVRVFEALFRAGVNAQISWFFYSRICNS